MPKRITNCEQVIRDHYDQMVRPSLAQRIIPGKEMRYCKEYVKAYLKDNNMPNRKIEVVKGTTEGEGGHIVYDKEKKCYVVAINFDYIESVYPKYSFEWYEYVNEILNHELRHDIQTQEAQSKKEETPNFTISQRAETSREEKAQRTDYKNFYDPDDGNYEKVIFEMDARRTQAIQTATQFLRAIKGLNRKQIKHLVDVVQESITMDNKEYDELKYLLGDDILFNRTKLVSELADCRFAKFPQLLKHETFLKYEYDEETGRRKTIDELLKTKEDVLRNCDPALKDQYLAMFAPMTYCQLRNEYSDGEFKDFICSYGKDRVEKEIADLRRGFCVQAEERKREYEKYKEFNDKYLKTNRLAGYNVIDSRIENLFAQRAFVEDPQTHQIIDLDSPEFNDVKALEEMIAKSPNYPMYSYEEMEMRRQERIERSFEEKNKDIKTYELIKTTRKKELAQKKAYEEAIAAKQNKKRSTLDILKGIISKNKQLALPNGNKSIDLNGRRKCVEELRSGLYEKLDIAIEAEMELEQKEAIIERLKSEDALVSQLDIEKEIENEKQQEMEDGNYVR